MKKLFALVLALAMVMSLATTAFAASGTNPDANGNPVNTGKIVINGAEEGYTYSVWQILVLTSWDTEKEAYIYKAATGWEGFVAKTEYLSVDADTGVVSWSTTEGHSTEDAVAQFAKDALAYAKTNSIAATKTATATANGAEFTGLNLGYYLVDSSVGALCSLDGVVTTSYIDEKNPIPILDKKVQDASGNFQESISSRIGKEETFGSKITVYNGTDNLVYHDVMDSTLDYVKDSVKVYYTPLKDNKVVDSKYYIVNEACTAHDDPNTAAKDSITCTFEVKFTDEFLATITEATEITITYKAALNKTAVIAGTGNVNDAMITFGDNGYSTWDDAVIYTYQFGIVKTDVIDNIVEGAEFELYYSATGNDKIALVEEKPTYAGFTAVEGVNYYRPATDAEKNADGFVSAVIKAGKACVWGVRGNVAMYLEETKAPDGYNAIVGRHHITALQDKNNIPVFNDNGEYVSGGIEIENLKGTQLPQTGGVGTTLFYVFGTILVAAAGVLLVTKKRMTAEN